jgi:hypothetical protein
MEKMGGVLGDSSRINLAWKSFSMVGICVRDPAVKIMVEVNGGWEWTCKGASELLAAV